MKKILLLLLFIPLVFSCSKDPVIHTLTTSANPTDGGTVSPTTKEYEQGESATITAFPSYSYEFLNWSNGLGTSNSTTVVMDSDKAITANFGKKTPSKIKFEVEEKRLMIPTPFAPNKIAIIFVLIIWIIILNNCTPPNIEVDFKAVLYESLTNLCIC